MGRRIGGGGLAKVALDVLDSDVEPRELLLDVADRVVDALAVQLVRKVRLRAGFSGDEVVEAHLLTRYGRNTDLIRTGHDPG